MITCLIRAIQVAATPEEIVRQNLIRQMVGSLGFPKGLIAVEREIGKRRFDLLCYRKVEGGVSPLLLVECKAEAIDDTALKQVLGYNDSIGAPFLCLAGGAEIKTVWREKSGLKSVPFLPSYSQLVDTICKLQR